MLHLGDYRYSVAWESLGGNRAGTESFRVVGRTVTFTRSIRVKEQVSCPPFVVGHCLKPAPVLVGNRQHPCHLDLGGQRMEASISAKFIFVSMCLFLAKVYTSIHYWGDIG